jgi:hypothetical protein
MPGANAKTKKSGVKPGAAKKAHATRVKRKEGRAVKASDAVADKYIEDLREGNETKMCLALVTGVSGGGRFRAFDMVHDENVVAKVAPSIFTKKAKHRNAAIAVAVRVDSYVILDEAHDIKAVVGEADAYTIRRLLNIADKAASNNLFNRGSGSKKSGSKRSSSKKSSKSKSVNINAI